MKRERYDMIVRSIERQREIFGDDYDKALDINRNVSPEDIERMRRKPRKWTSFCLMRLYQRVEVEVRSEGLKIQPACEKVSKDGLWFEAVHNKGENPWGSIQHHQEKWSPGSAETIRAKYYEAKSLVEADEAKREDCEFWIDVFLQARRSGRKAADIISELPSPKLAAKLCKKAS